MAKVGIILKNANGNQKRATRRAALICVVSSMLNCRSVVR